MFENTILKLNTPAIRFVFLVLIPAGFIGFFVLPNFTFFLIEEQPFSLNATAVTEEGETSCQNCHYDVQAEILSTPHHTGFDCEVCHKGMNRNVSCTECHALIDFDAHARFMDWAQNSTTMVSTNEACVGCHTNAHFEAYNLSTRKDLNFNADARLLH